MVAPKLPEWESVTVNDWLVTGVTVQGFIRIWKKNRNSESYCREKDNQNETLYRLSTVHSAHSVEVELNPASKRIVTKIGLIKYLNIPMDPRKMNPFRIQH